MIGIKDCFGCRSAAGYIDELDAEIFPFVSYEGYPDRYPARSVMEKPDDFYREMRQAARQLLAVFSRALRVFQKCPDEFMQMMDIPEKMRPYLDIPNRLNCPTFLSRFDFVLDRSGQFRCIELNADTLCAVVEAYYGNRVAADYVRRRDPNEGALEQLQSLLDRISGVNPSLLFHPDHGDLQDRPFVFSCFHDYIEDRKR